MSTLAIRPFHREEDEAAVLELWRACGLVVPWNNPARDIDRKMQVNPELFFVGMVEETPVATCMAGYEGHRGWINYLAVSPEIQGKGFGAAMMRHAEDALRSLGCPKINLQVRTSNEDVIRFYHSLGYTVDEVVGMGKRLEPDEPISLD